MDERQYTIEELKELGVVGQAQKANAVGPHGVNALLNAAGVRPDMHSTVVRPTNFAEALPVFPSVYENELYEVLTGQTADSGTNPDDSCTAPAVTGYLKTAQVKAVFGKVWKGTKQIPISDLAKYKDRADMNRQLINWAGTPPSKFTPSVLSSNNLNTVLGKELREFDHSLHLGISHVNIQGSTANTGSSAYSGFTKEWDGVDAWIKTGYTDVPSSVAAPALDSNVTDYANGTLDSDWYTHFANVVRTQMQLADMTGFGAVTWALLTHPYSEYPIIDTVSCAFPSTRCSIGGATDTGRRLDVTLVNNLRQDMQNQMYVPVDNMRVPIITDWGVAATYNAATNVWTSDMYLVPIASATGEALTYVEYLPYDNALIGSTINSLGAQYDHQTMNNGMYLVGRSNTYNCISFNFEAQMRLIMRTPFLAARIDNVNYTSNTPFRSPVIGETYYKNGGQYLRA